MKHFDGPEGTRFEYDRELEGTVFIRGSKLSPRFQCQVSGVDLLSFIKHLIQEAVEDTANDSVVEEVLPETQ